MPFDPVICYPRISVAASLAAAKFATAHEQLDHSDLALPAANVTPRLTTAEALAEVLRNAERGTSASTLEAWEVLETGTKPTRRYEAHFHYADGSRRAFG